MTDLEVRRLALEAAARVHDGSAWSAEGGISAAASVIACAEEFAAWLEDA